MTSGITEWDQFCTQAEKYRLLEQVFSSNAKENGEQKEPVPKVDDDILEEMVGHPKIRDIFKIIHQPTGNLFIETFGLESK